LINDSKRPIGGEAVQGGGMRWGVWGLRRCKKASWREIDVGLSSSKREESG